MGLGLAYRLLGARLRGQGWALEGLCLTHHDLHLAQMFDFGVEDHRFLWRFRRSRSIRPLEGICNRISTVAVAVALFFRMALVDAGGGREDDRGGSVAPLGSRGWRGGDAQIACPASEEVSLTPRVGRDVYRMCMRHEGHSREGGRADHHTQKREWHSSRRGWRWPRWWRPGDRARRPGGRRSGQSSSRT